MSDVGSMGFRVQIDNYPPQSGEVTVRQIAAGIQSFILIEPEVDGDELVLRVTASGLSDSTNDVVEALAAFCGAIEEAASPTGGEES